MSSVSSQLAFELAALERGIKQAARGRSEIYKWLRGAMEEKIRVKMVKFGAAAAWVTNDDVRPLVIRGRLEAGNWLGNVFRADPRFVKVVELADYTSCTEGSHGNKLHRWTLREYAEEVRMAA